MTAEQAAQLIRKLADGTASLEEIQALETWYHSVHQEEAVIWPTEDPAEAKALQTRILARLEQRIKDAQPARVIEMPHHKRSIGIVWKVAACFLLVAGAWLVIRQSAPSQQSFVSIDNPSGSIRNITLADGSQVWLNAGSQLQYAENYSAHRTIRLKGEAYFEVADDKAHPFTVESGELRTTVLGTRFNVRSFDEEEELSVTVIRGKVQVDKKEKEEKLDILTPARQLQYDRSAHAFTTLTVDTTAVLAWQQGKLQFNGQTMDVIAGTLGRWYKMRFVFHDSAVRNCRLIGQFRSDTPLKDVLTSINTLLDIKYLIDDKNKIVTLYGKGCTPNPK